MRTDKDKELIREYLEEKLKEVNMTKIRGNFPKAKFRKFIEKRQLKDMLLELE